MGMCKECYKGVKLSIMCQPLCDYYCFAVKQNCALTADCGATETTPHSNNPCNGAGASASKQGCHSLQR